MAELPEYSARLKKKIHLVMLSYCYSFRTKLIKLWNTCFEVTRFWAFEGPRSSLTTGRLQFCSLWPNRATANLLSSPHHQLPSHHQPPPGQHAKVLRECPGERQRLMFLCQLRQNLLWMAASNSKGHREGKTYHTRVWLGARTDPPSAHRHAGWLSATTSSSGSHRIGLPCCTHYTGP